MSTRPFPSDLATIEGELHSKWGWFVVLGVAGVALEEARALPPSAPLG